MEHRHLDHLVAGRGLAEGLYVVMEASSSYSSLLRIGQQIRYFHLLFVDEKSRFSASYHCHLPKAFQNVFELAFSKTDDRCVSGLCRPNSVLY